MRDESTKGMIEFLFDCAAYALVAMIWYCPVLLRCLPGWTYAQSRALLWGMLGVSIVFCAFGLNRLRRTGWSAAAAIAIPLGIYTVFSYAKTVGAFLAAVLLCAGVFVLIFAVRLLTRRIKNPQNRRKVICRRLYRCGIFAQSMAAAALILVMGALSAGSLYGAGVLHAKVPASVGTQSDQTIRGQMDTVLCLQQERWQDLTTQEKLDTLQTVANIEAHYLGLPHELTIGAANLDEGMLAAYDDRTHTIRIDLDHLERDAACAVLDSCCHEAYHAYQHRLVDAYAQAEDAHRNLRLFRAAARYGQEFYGYIDGEEDFGAYYNQDCETDARAYAQSAVSDYYSKIDEYLSEKTGSGQ